MSATQQRMKRVIVDHFGGPEVLRVVEEDVPQPGPGEVRVRVLAAGVSFTDSQLRAGTYLGVPKPPFTPGYELVGVVEELGPRCTRRRVGDRIGALTVVHQDLLARTPLDRANERGSQGGFGLRARVSGVPCGSPRRADAAASREA